MDTFEHLLSSVATSLERFVRYRINSYADADDILQEIYLSAYQKFGQLKEQDAFKAWILSIARNKCNDYFRKKAVAYEIPFDKLNEKVLSFGRYGLSVVHVVRDTLCSLEDKDKQILYLYFWKDIPQAEIAKMLNVPLGTVKSRLYTAKQRFKEQYPYHTDTMKGELSVKNLPEFLPDYSIKKSQKSTFSVKWEELWGLLIIPKVGEKLTWGLYETVSKRLTEWGELNVIGRAIIHDVEGVEIKENRHIGDKNSEFTYIAQLTDTHCRMLAENYMKDGVRKLVTFLDGDAFTAEWGYGLNNCGKETYLESKGKITEESGGIRAANTDQLCDIVGRYTVTINGKEYDTVRVLNLDSYYGEYVCCEQYIDVSGRTVLWRRFNRNDWNVDKYEKLWSEQLPHNETLTINDETYVHWYDCITDYIL